MKLQHSTTQIIDDLQNCQYYNEKQIIYKINLRPWTLPGTRFFNAHTSVKLKEGEGSVFTSDGWAILDIMPGWEIVKGAKAVKPAQPAQPTQQEQPKENTQPAQQETTTPAQEQEQQPAAAPQPKKEQAQPAPAAQKPAAQGSNAFSAMLDFSNFAAAMEAKIKEAVLAELPKIQPAAQPETKRETITVKDGQQIGKVQGHTCRNFSAIVRTVAQSVPVYMYGPAGCGKSHTAKQVAESLGLDFYETSTVLFAHEMKGYGDANGHFIDTPFYKAFVNGGLFFLDEVDASAPDALVVLNTAIANGRFDFPVVGNKTAHKDFRVMAAGNTLMTGADIEYTARAVQDKSFINRFFFIGFDYDPEIEKAITANDTELIEFAHDFRQAAACAGLSVCLSYRQLAVLSNKELQAAWPLDQLVKNSFLSCLSVDDINVICGNMTDKQNRWSKAINELSK